MYDIEVIDNHSYAVIAAGSPAYEFLKAMNSKLVMKKLASEPGEAMVLSTSEALPLCRGFQIKALKRLIDVGLLETNFVRVFNYGSMQINSQTTFTFTAYGLEVVKWIKDTGEDVEILLN